MAPRASTYNFYLAQKSLLQTSAAPQLLLLSHVPLLQGATYLFMQALLHHEH